MYTKTTAVMAEILEEHYIYNDMLTLIKHIYVILQATCCQFKKYINTMNIKAGFRQCKTGTCLLYRVNELGTEIVIVYVYGTLKIRDKTTLIDIIE